MRSERDFEYPTNIVLVDESKVRLTALSVLIIAAIYLATCHWVLPAFLVVDFLLRALNLGEYSVLNIVSDNLVHAFNITVMPIERAPRRFAAIIGFIFSVAILALTFFNYAIISTLLSCILALFAFLESFIGFCSGCYIYKFCVRLFKKKENRFKKQKK
jgi:Domain of unknown function (DUF4395)